MSMVASLLWQVGLASLSAAVLRSGGSESHPSATLDRILEELAAGIEGFALPEALVVGKSPMMLHT